VDDLDRLEEEADKRRRVDFTTWNRVTRQGGDLKAARAKIEQERRAFRERIREYETYVRADDSSGRHISP
jgi:hypothetical protein